MRTQVVVVVVVLVMEVVVVVVIVGFRHNSGERIWNLQKHSWGADHSGRGDREHFEAGVGRQSLDQIGLPSSRWPIQQDSRPRLDAHKRAEDRKGETERREYGANREKAEGTQTKTRGQVEENAEHS
jgi:hypothetical protein